MALPGNVNTVRVRGYWFDQDGTGYSAGSVTFTPQDDELTDTAAFAYIRTEIVTVNPDPTTGYFFADLIATNDPDLTAFAWQVTRTAGGGALVAQATIAVPYTAATVDVGAGVMKQALWLVDAATTTSPPVGPVFYTADQTDQAIATAVGGLVGGPVGDATTVGKGILRLAGDLSGTAASPTVPALASKVTSVTNADATITMGGTATAPTVAVNAIPESAVTNLVSDLAGMAADLAALGSDPGETYNLIVQEVVDRQVADGDLAYEISKRYQVDPGVGIPERDLSDGVQTKLNSGGSGGGGSSSTASGLTSPLSLGDRHVAEDAGISEAKLALAADAHPEMPSRRTLGLGPLQAMPGDTFIPQLGTDAPPLVSGLVPASYLPSGSVAGAPLDTATLPSPLGVPAAGVNVRSSPADHIHPRPAVFRPGDHGLLSWSFDPANVTSSAVLTAGTLQLVKLWVPGPCTVTGIILNAVTGGNATMANCYVALFDASKNLLSQSANLASAWGTSAGDKKGDLAAPQTISTARYVFAGFWVGTATSPAFARSSGLSSGLSGNVNLTGTALRYSTANIGLTTTAPSTAAAQAAANVCYFAGLY